MLVGRRGRWFGVGGGGGGGVGGDGGGGGWRRVILYSNIVTKRVIG